MTFKLGLNLKNWLFAIVYFSFQAASAQSDLNSLYEAAKIQLKAKYSVLEGHVDIFSSDKCSEAIQYFGNCFGANPAAPYIIPVFEAAPNEYLDPNYPPSMKIVKNGKNFYGVNRMGATEARIVFIKLPPRAAYFGLQTYLFSEYGAPKKSLASRVLPSTQHPNPKRFSVFNSISNSVNQVVIARQLGTEDAWLEGLIAIVTTSDSTTLAEVKDSLIKAGLSDKQIFSETLGYNNQMGFGESKNDYISLIRYALPEDGTGRTYQTKPKITALRVIAKGRSNNLPFARQPIEPRIALSETSYEAGLDNLSYLLQTRLIPTATELNFISPLMVGIDTYKCEDKNRNCLGDTRDTDTYLASATFTFDKNQVLILTGVNHNKSNNSTYFSISINDKEEVRPAFLVDSNGNVLDGISQVSPVAGFAPENYQVTMDNSVNRLFNDLNIGTPSWLSGKLNKYWAKVIVRNPALCKGIRDCYILSTDRNAGVPLDREVRILRRVYIKPGTARGPNPKSLLNPRLFIGN